MTGVQTCALPILTILLSLISLVDKGEGQLISLVDKGEGQLTSSSSDTSESFILAILLVLRRKL